MPRPVRIAVLLLFLCSALAVALRLFGTEERLLHRHAKQIERELYKREQAAEKFLNQVTFTPWLVPSQELLAQNWGLAPFNIAWYRADSLVFLLNALYLPLDFKPGSETGAFLWWESPPYAGIKKEVGENLQAVIWIPLRVMPNAALSDQPTPYTVKTQSGQTLAWLRAEGPIQDPVQRGLMFCLIAFAAAAAAYLLNKAARELSRRFSPWWGGLFLLACTGAIGYFFGGTLLANTLLLLWLMIFFHREFQDYRFPPLPPPVAMLLSAANYLAITLGMLLIALTIRNLVFNSGLDLYLDNLFQISWEVVVAILTLVLLFLAFFLFSHRMIVTTVAIGLRPAFRMVSFAVSIGIGIPFFLWAGLPFPLEGLVLAALVYIGMLDLFADEENPNLTWMIGWLAIIAAFTAILVSGFHLEKEDISQRALTEAATESLSALPENGLEYALYDKGALVVFSPQSNFPVREENLAGSADSWGLTRTVSTGRVEWISRNANGITAVTRREIAGIMGPLSLFSYLFALLILLMPALGLLNSWFQFLPNNLNFLQFNRPTLSSRIQLWVVGFLLMSFLLIGAITVWNFRQSASYNQELLVRQKIDAILQETQARIAAGDTSVKGKQIFETLQYLARLQGVDILIFHPTGGLTASVLPSGAPAVQYLNGISQYRLLQKTTRIDLQKERAGHQRYRTAYIAVWGARGEVLAYLGLPLFEQAGSWQKELSEFISALINVYVFLLLFAGAFAIFIANSITRPISELGARLRTLNLKENEPLVYNRKDEVGNLIEEYNLTLEKLKESTRKLALSERESAWREMAKKVAHEIKNPLTSLKLTIQIFPQKLSMQPERAKEIAERTTAAILEEVDKLDEIATVFSSFSKLPEANNALFSLNELLRNVYELFCNEPGFGMDIELPEEDIFVFADKNQLNRVFTNLYKNAIQATPDGKAGQISCRLFTQENQALVQISDKGAGIPEEMREKVFVPNFTTKNTGSGLGLAMSKNIVEAANGRIYFESELGRGTDFFVSLPLATA